MAVPYTRKRKSYKPDNHFRGRSYRKSSRSGAKRVRELRYAEFLKSHQS